MAVTLREYEVTEAYRAYGADMQLFELGENTEIEINMEVERLCLKDPELPCPWENKAAADTWIEEMGLRERPRWRFLPVEEHLKVPGIKAASPVGRYRVEPLSREIGVEGTYMGIDRSTFIDVAYWENEFADENLGALMNALAIAPNRMLVSRDTAERLSMRIGDRVPVKVRIDDPGTVGQFQEVNLILEVAGFVDGFPTWQPGDGPLFIGNLPYLYQEAGGQFPHHVWLKADSHYDPVDIYRMVRSQDFNVQSWNAPGTRVDTAFNSPEYQGIMGLLSTGFLISTCLTIVGLLLYVFFSYKRRSIEVGALRAIGLAKSQVTTLMIWELLMLMILGTLGGTGIGLGISRIIIPHMHFGEIQNPRLLTPIAVHYSWQHMLMIYGIFSVLFGVMIVILIAALNRIRIYAVLKMGDTM
jgi:putative ABC transport system permease protein